MRVNNGLTPQDLKAYGINDVQDIVHNPSYDTLYQEELAPNLEGYERGVLTNLGAIAVDTGIFTGRSPKDKYIVRDDTTRDTVWWADKGKGKNDNKPLSEETWQHLKGLVTRQLSGKRLFIVDAFCGANADTRLSVRFITEVAWQAHFVKNMFIRPSEEELANFKPDFIVMNGAKCTNPQWKEQGLNSENFVAFNLTERIQLIGGTWYGGEMKKGMFSIMNYLLPLKGIASMHCSANVGEKEDVAIFFGLSGTGKTTLSTDPKRRLIGDDEHGWDDDGVFNFEGGCYAKTIKLSEAAEPDIYHAIRRDALLENVVVLADGTIDFNDGSKTENTRVSYPINHIENIVKPISKAGHATKVIFLTADAFGVSAAGFSSDRRPDPVPLPVWLHRQAGRYRARRHGADANLLRLLWRRLPVSAPNAVRRSASETHAGFRRPGLSGQHRLERYRQTYLDQRYSRHYRCDS